MVSVSVVPAVVDEHVASVRPTTGETLTYNATVSVLISDWKVWRYEFHKNHHSLMMSYVIMKFKPKLLQVMAWWLIACCVPSHYQNQCQLDP